MILTSVSFALYVLFAASGLLALATLGLTWAAYGRELGVLRAQLANSAEWRTFEVRTAATRVREFTVPVRRLAQRGRVGTPGATVPSFGLAGTLSGWGAGSAAAGVPVSAAPLRRFPAWRAVA